MNAFFFSRISCRQRIAFGVGLAAMAACGVGAFFNSRQFFISYLFAWLFWLGLSLGCLCMAMINYLTGGRWGEVTRRFFEAGYMTLPLTALLSVPILAGARELYHQSVIPLGLRGAFYFFIWITLANTLRKWSLQQDHTGDLGPTRQARALSGPGIVIYILTMALASMDWITSINHDAWSLMLPIVICGGQILASLAFVTLMLDYFRREPPFLSVVEPRHYHQLGKLLLIFVTSWTCACFGGPFTDWSGVRPYSVDSYFHRLADDGSGLDGFQILLIFLPAFLLLRLRSAERRIQSLRYLAGAVFLGQLVTIYWLAESGFFPGGWHLHWMDLAAPAAVGGLWIARFAVSFKRAAILHEDPARVSYSLVPV
jgi:hypothetical protein